MSWLIIAFSVVEWGIRILMVPVILRRRFTPATSMAWLSLIFFIPVLGLVVYGLVGANRLGKRRTRLHRTFIKSMRSYRRTADLKNLVVRPEVDPALLPMILQAERISRMPILGGNQVELLFDAEQAIERLIADIDAARQHVHLLFYIFRPDQIGQRVADALIRASHRGVNCRVLADAAGSRHLFSRRGLAWHLNQQGVCTHRALPAAPLRRKLARLDLRNHRKLAVIDGVTAYTGSQNIVNTDFGHRRAGRWIDVTGRFTGPVVGQLQAVFLDDWGFETRHTPETPDIFPLPVTFGDVSAQAVATGPTQESFSLLRVILTAINTAQKRIVITSPYLVPDEPTILALSMAADRGVQVQIVVPRRSDHPLVSAAGRAHFDRLLRFGVGIYLHEPGMLHAKTMTVDDAFALLGSSNMDVRSFHLNFELNVLLYGSRVTDQLRTVQLEYLHEATRVDPRRWARRSPSQQFFDSTAALLSPLL